MEPKKGAAYIDYTNRVNISRGTASPRSPSIMLWDQFLSYLASINVFGSLQMQERQSSETGARSSIDLVDISLRLPYELLQSIIMTSFKALEFEASSKIGFASYLLEHRRRRQHSFPMKDICDPCVNIILDLYTTPSQKRPADITSLSIASGAPFSSGMRYVDKLVSMGMAVRVTDPSDKRRANIFLSDDCRARLELWFDNEIHHLIHDFLTVHISSALVCAA